MRVTHCVPIFSELTQTFVYDLVRHMDVAMGNISVNVITWHRKNPYDRPFDSVTTIAPPSAQDVARIRLARIAPSCMERLLPPSSFEQSLAQRLQSLDTDIIHAHFGVTAVLIERACRMADVPLLVTFRGRDASAKLQKPHWRRLYRRTFQGTAAIACVSEHLLTMLRPLIPKGIKCYVIFGGKQQEAITYRPPKQPNGRLVSVGRLIEKKGHADAIRALARARQHRPTLSLTIIGDGPLRESLEREAEIYGVRDAVTFTGGIPYSSVLEHLSESDFLIAACHTADNGDSEGIPNVVKEAQLAGLPVIATRHGGIPQAVPPQARKFLTDERDPDAIAERILALFDSPLDELKDIAQAGRDYVVKEFNPTTEIQAYCNVYQDILDPDCTLNPYAKQETL